MLEICEDLFGGMPISLAIMAETQMLPKVSTLYSRDRSDPVSQTDFDCQHMLTV